MCVTVYFVDFFWAEILFHPLMSCHAPFPAPVLAAALCPRPIEWNVGLPHGSYGLPHGLSHQPL